MNSILPTFSNYCIAEFFPEKLAGESRLHLIIFRLHLIIFRIPLEKVDLNASHVNCSLSCLIVNKGVYYLPTNRKYTVMCFFLLLISLLLPGGDMAREIGG